MKKMILFMLALMLAGADSRAQVVDTLAIKKLLKFESEMDSLRQQLRLMDGELQRVKANVAEGSDIEKLLAALNEDDMESAPEDQRSRRKRVDALLKIITDRPGQLRFNGGATAILQGNPERQSRFSTGVGSFDIYAHTSFGSNTLLFFDFEAIGGNGPDTHVPAFTTLNGDAGSTQEFDGVDRLTVLEAWAEFSMFKETITLTAGKIDLTNYFDNNASANDETSQFISGAFVNSAALPIPANSPGLRLRTTLLKRFFLQAGLASTDNSGDQILDKLFKIASMGFKVFPESDWEANLRMYTYVHPSAGDAGGYGLSYDESIAGAFNVFGRYNRNEAKMARWKGISSAWSVGGRIVRTIAGRRLAIGAAFGETVPVDHALKHEKLIEIYFRHQLNKWVYMSPHVQLLRNGAGSERNATLLGFRAQFNF